MFMVLFHMPIFTLVIECNKQVKVLGRSNAALVFGALVLLMKWKTIKAKTERKWRNAKIDPYVWGLQTCPGNTWNDGLSEEEIKNLEKIFGFTFPDEYRSMLSVLNGFALDSINTNCQEENESYSRNCYKYPDDFERVRWLKEEIDEYRKFVNEVLFGQGFPSDEIEGFVPLYGHRALVVFKNKELSPVISIVGNDVVIYGKSLELYLENEFLNGKWNC